MIWGAGARAHNALSHAWGAQVSGAGRAVEKTPCKFEFFWGTSLGRDEMRRTDSVGLRQKAATFGQSFYTKCRVIGGFRDAYN